MTAECTVKPRIQIAQAAEWKCFWCKQDTREELGYQNTATIEHLTPKSKKGTNDPSNLYSACHRCNQARGNMNGYKFRLIAQAYVPDTRSIRTHEHDMRNALQNGHKKRQKMLVNRVSRGAT